jgi:hypothetical protein
MTSVEASLKRDLGAVRFAWWQAWTLLGLAILQGWALSSSGWHGCAARRGVLQDLSLTPSPC